MIAVAMVFFRLFNCPYMIGLIFPLLVFDECVYAIPALSWCHLLVSCLLCCGWRDCCFPKHGLISPLHTVGDGGGHWLTPLGSLPSTLPVGAAVLALCLRPHTRSCASCRFLRRAASGVVLAPPQVSHRVCLLCAHSRAWTELPEIIRLAPFSRSL